MTQQVDYEVELGVIISTAGRGIRHVDAYSHVRGYINNNEVTARDLQKNHKRWFLGKSQGSFSPPIFLKLGDEIQMTIDGLGELCNPIGPNLGTGAAS